VASTTFTIPVMAITASAMAYNRESMLAEGFDGYQIKPFNLSSFLADVASLISQNSLIAHLLCQNFARTICSNRFESVN
jgi:CheY-like chemotaxis protein